MRIPHFLALAFLLVEFTSSAAKKPNIVYITVSYTHLTLPTSDLV